MEGPFVFRSKPCNFPRAVWTSTSRVKRLSWDWEPFDAAMVCRETVQPWGANGFLLRSSGEEQRLNLVLYFDTCPQVKMVKWFRSDRIDRPKNWRSLYLGLQQITGRLSFLCASHAVNRDEDNEGEEIASVDTGFKKDTSWWKKSCTTWDVQNLVNNGISYQPQLVQYSFHQQYPCTSLDHQWPPWILLPQLRWSSFNRLLAAAALVYNWVEHGRLRFSYNIHHLDLPSTLTGMPQCRNANDWEQIWMGIPQNEESCAMFALESTRACCSQEPFVVSLPGHKFVGFGGCMCLHDIHMLRSPDM